MHIFVNNDNMYILIVDEYKEKTKPIKSKDTYEKVKQTMESTQYSDCQYILYNVKTGKLLNNRDMTNVAINDNKDIRKSLRKYFKKNTPIMEDNLDAFMDDMHYYLGEMGISQEPKYKMMVIVHSMVKSPNKTESGNE